MNRSIKVVAPAVVLGMQLSLAGTVAWGAGPEQATDADSPARVASFRGAPPFNRHRATPAEAGETLIAARPDARATGDFRGKPPFKRTRRGPSLMEEGVVTERFARFEEVEEAPRSQRARRVGPPGKYPRRQR